MGSNENVLIRPRHVQLLRMKELAVVIGVSPAYLSAMKRAGWVPSHAGRSTVQAALKWLEEHPDFRVRQVYRKAERGKVKDFAAA